MSCTTAFWWICCNQRVEDAEIDIPMPVRHHRDSKYPSLAGARDAGVASASIAAAGAAHLPGQSMPSEAHLQQQFSSRRLSEGAEDAGAPDDGRPPGGWGRLGVSSSDGEAGAAAQQAAGKDWLSTSTEQHQVIAETGPPHLDYSEMQPEVLVESGLAEAQEQHAPAIALASRGARISEADSLGLDASMLLPHPPLDHHAQLQQQRLQEQLAHELEEQQAVLSGREQGRKAAGSAGNSEEEADFQIDQQQGPSGGGGAAQQEAELAQHTPPPPPPPPPRVVFLYASQTGTAREVARTLHAEAAVRGMPADVLSLNELGLPGLGGQETPVVVIAAASTGDGDAPGNAAVFFKALRSPQPPGRLAGVKFALLGLGSSAYIRYMNVPRILRTRLLELGATEFYASAEADAERQQEAKIDTWCEHLWDPLRIALEEATRAQAARAFLAAEGIGGGDILPPPAPPTAAAATEPGEGPASVTVESAPSSSAQDIIDLSADRRRSSAAASDGTWPGTALEGATSFKAGRVASLPLPTATISFDVSPEVAKFARARELSHPSLEQRSYRDPSGAYSAAAPFWSRVAGARLLSAPGSDRIVLLAHLDISGSGMRYSAGDAIGMLPQNDPERVSKLLQRLALDGSISGDDVFEVKPPGGTSSAHAGGSLLPHLGAPCTLRHALTHGVELVGAPQKSLLRLLAESCDDEEQKRDLLFLCSPEGRDNYAREIASSHASLLDVLQRFPSCHPPIGALLDALPPLAPRLYSVACMGTAPGGPAPSQVEITFSVVRVPTPEGARAGVASGWLYRQLEPWLERAAEGASGTSGRADADDPFPSSTPPPETWLPLFLRPAEAFVPPPSLTTPLIMIGHGTGLAPFRAFLQQRATAAAAETAAGPLGEAWLYAGCRRRDEDFLFGDELVEFERTGLLSRLRVAASREGEKKVYVQHLIRADAAALAALIITAGARIYVCGDAGSMAKEVHAALVAALASAVGLSESEAEEELKVMAENGTYVREVHWS